MNDRFRHIGLVFILCFALASPLVAIEANVPKADVPKADAPKADAPKADALDSEMRALLLSADRLEVGVETAYPDDNAESMRVEIYQKIIGDFPLERMRAWIEKSEMIPKKVNLGWGTRTIPGLYFSFYKDKKMIAILYLDYGNLPNTRFMNLEKETHYKLQPQSAATLRLIVARQPQFIKELMRLGAKSQDLAPQRAYEIKN